MTHTMYRHIDQSLVQQLRIAEARFGFDFDKWIEVEQPECLEDVIRMVVENPQLAVFAIERKITPDKALDLYEYMRGVEA